MEYTHVSQINFSENINHRVYGIFLAQDVDVRTQSDGETKFITLNMIDHEFKMDAKKFGATEQEIQLMKTGKVYYAAIDVKLYKNKPSCVIYNFDEYTHEPASNFISWAEGMQEAYQLINETLGYISGTIYKNIVTALIMDNWQKFSVWAAASGMHHNLPGGLLVHTAEVIKQARSIADTWNNHYGEKFINLPLLVSACLIHDIAKIHELAVDISIGTVEYSKDSALETHITMCVSMLEIEAYKQKFGYQTDDKSEETMLKEKEALKLLKHCILAHHGKKEYGSPIDMNCPEAYILHTADSLSAEMYRYNRNFKTMEPGSMNAVWLGGNICVTYKGTEK